MKKISWVRLNRVCWFISLLFCTYLTDKEELQILFFIINSSYSKCYSQPTVCIIFCIISLCLEFINSHSFKLQRRGIFLCNEILKNIRTIINNFFRFYFKSNDFKTLRFYVQPFILKNPLMFYERNIKVCHARFMNAKVGTFSVL